MRTIDKLTSVIVTATLGAAVLAGRAASEEPTYRLRSRRAPGTLDRVETALEVGGNLKVIVDDKVNQLKMSVLANLLYDERSLAVAPGSDDPLRSIRHYQEAAALLQVGENRLKPTLRDQRRLIGVEIAPSTVTLFSPQGPLTRDELDLVDVLGNSLLLDRLLPQQPVAVGGSWKHAETLLMALLGLDSVGQAEAESKLTEVSGQTAKVEITGQVKGTAGGAATEIELKGKYHFDLSTGRMTWFGLLVRESRSVGHVETGFDVVARLQMKISPVEESANLTDAALKDFSLEPTAELTQLSYDSPEGGWQFAHDRRWFIHSDHAEVAVLRLIDRGDLLAQCKISALPKLTAGKQTALAAFQDDVRHALGDNFKQFLRASQQGNDADYRVYRVAVQGETSDLVMQWIYYLVADKHGHRVVLAFIFEDELADRFDQADEGLLSTLRLVDRQVASKPKNEGPQQGGER